MISLKLIFFFFFFLCDHIFEHWYGFYKRNYIMKSELYKNMFTAVEQLCSGRQKQKQQQQQKKLHILICYFNSYCVSRF